MKKKEYNSKKHRQKKERENQKEQGYFDGRFVERSETPKKYKKPKYKNWKNYTDEEF